MKKIGLLGGTSWPSTIEYYRILNEQAQAHFGDGHSAKLLLWSIDYFEIRQHYPDGWHAINAILQRELEYLNDLKPGCIVICNNTLHESYDAIKNKLKLDVPVIHMADLAAKHVKDTGCQHVLLTGTQYTMECGYYTEKLVKNGIKVTIPELDDRILIQSMQQNIAKGKSTQGFAEAFKEIIAKHSTCDAIITACTELPLIVTSDITELKIIDPLKIQCAAAFDFATNLD